MYRLLCYQPHNIHASSSGYVPPRLVKPLRTGAEDEVITLPQAPAPLSVRTSMSVDAMVAEDVRTMAEAQVEEKESPREIVQPVVVSTLKPPEALFKPIDYPPLHIMVSVLVLVHLHIMVSVLVLVLKALFKPINYPPLHIMVSVLVLVLKALFKPINSLLCTSWSVCLCWSLRPSLSPSTTLLCTSWSVCLGWSFCTS